MKQGTQWHTGARAAQTAIITQHFKWLGVELNRKVDTAIFSGHCEWSQGWRLTWAWLPGLALIWDEAAHTTVAKAAQLRPSNSATSQLQPSPATTTSKLPREHRSQPKSWGQDEAWNRAAENDLHEPHQQKLTWELLLASCQLVHVLKNVPSSTETTTVGSKWDRMKKAENNGIYSHLNSLLSPSTKALRVSGALWTGNDGAADPASELWLSGLCFRSKSDECKSLYSVLLP